MPQKHLITVALLYANGPAHIGHLAGCYIPADIYARYLRSKGDDVLFVTGSDEHGVPITIKAEKEGITPQEVVDKYHKIIKDTFENFGISPDIYSRTSNPVHHETSQAFFKTLYENGKFIEETTEQYYDPKVNKFLADRYIIGTCPKCGNENAYGDQCEKCGTTLSPDELINPHSALSGEKPIKKETKNWYLPLDKIQDSFLNAYISSHSHWKSNVFGQASSWLKEGLKPRAMTRDLDWGIKLPLPDTEGKVLYVWFDAPIGYISMTKEYFEKDNSYFQKYNIGINKTKNNTKENLSYLDYWGKNSDAKLTHFIGKDNIVFHSLIFPAMCHEHGGYKTADEIPANEFLNLEGEKISTSRNWAVWAHEYLEDFPNQQDALRYFLTSNAPENKDNNFTWKDFQTANNSELVGILGNFVNRVLVLTEKYYEGKVPTPTLGYDQNYFAGIINNCKEKTSDLLENFKFRDALAQAMELARFGNKFLADSEPWKLIRTDPEKTKDIIFASLQITSALVNLIEPFMPFSAEKLAKMLNIDKSSWVNNSHLNIGHQLGKPELLFSKIEDEAIDFQIQKLKNSKSNMMQTDENKLTEEVLEKVLPAQKPNISFDDFIKMDIRIGTILEAEKVEKADKLLKLKIDTGIDIRTVVSGIALYHKPEEIIGKQVSILLNLEPRKIKGIESQGMILMAEDADGKLDFVKPNSTLKNGSEVR
ncbi:MAG: methionine--tRNA ligase [Bacteroidetes bacterium]|nr:MAG: methionine--tRNA ligase [Bacteroidota bacterium]